MPFELKFYFVVIFIQIDRMRFTGMIFRLLAILVVNILNAVI